MFIDSFNQTIEIWTKALEQYSFTRLCTKPTSKSWSLGQLYTHLIEDTNYYMEQIKICVTTNDHLTGEASSAAKIMFLLNSFPDKVIEGDPSNACLPQPDSKEQLINGLIILKAEMNAAATAITHSPFQGKTKHPGLGFFSANEWLQFADMHLRHHFRQKERIDDFLKSNYIS